MILKAQSAQQEAFSKTLDGYEGQLLSLHAMHNVPGVRTFLRKRSSHCIRKTSLTYSMGQ